MATRAGGTGDPSAECAFCRVVDGSAPAEVVLRAPGVVAVLDHRPLFPGHVLVVPERHRPTLADLGSAELAPFFTVVQHVVRVLPDVMDAQGTFVATNNVVSQSVPHLHVHVVPRRRGDGLRGFFWPRQRYVDETQAREIAQRIAKALKA